MMRKKVQARRREAGHDCCDCGHHHEHPNHHSDSHMREYASESGYIHICGYNHGHGRVYIRGYIHNHAYSTRSKRKLVATLAQGRDVAAVLQQLLRARGLSIATAESCTGGLIARALTAAPGSSECFSYGLVTYSNEAKQKLLNVSAQTLAEHGAVSPETARAMAEGLQALSGADLCLAVTGVAGPGGGSVEKPVGLVYIALLAGEHVEVRRCQFAAYRLLVQALSMATALDMAVQYLRSGKEAIS